MALNPCVQQILCALSGTVLGSLNRLIDTQIAALQTQILIIEAQILQYDILTLPLEAAASLARTQIQNIRNSALLVPLNLIAGCTDLGDFNLGLQKSIDNAVADLDSIVGDLTRVLSFKEELNATVAELNGIIDQFQDILATIETCEPLIE